MGGNLNFPSRNYVLNRFPRITNWKINFPTLWYGGVHIYILQNLSFLLLHNLLDLILRAKLVKEVPGESWDVFQLANCLDPVMQVSILLKNKGRLWTHCRKFLRKECYYTLPAIAGFLHSKQQSFHLSLVQTKFAFLPSAWQCWQYWGGWGCCCCASSGDRPTP